MLGQRDLRAKASMQCLSGLVNEPYFVLFSSVGFNFKVLTLGRLGLASHLERTRRRFFSRSMYAEPATYHLHAGDRHAYAYVLSAPRPALQRETGESLAVGLSSPPLGTED
jgi:hypothetical protein